MNLCPNCAAEVIPGAKFCHRCGDKIAEKPKLCPACHAPNPQVSVFCHDCGFHFEAKKQRHVAYQPTYPLDFDPETLTEQVKALFFKNMRTRVAEEHDLAKYSHYVDRFYHSRFKDIYEVRANQIAEDALIQWERFGQNALPDIDHRIEAAFDGLLDYFFIQFCPDLNAIRLPETILRHEHAKPGKTDLWAMVRDFLDFDDELEVFHFDFVTMREDLLANACKSFLTAERKERVFFICDLSLKGTCKEGFALTNRAIYWRQLLDRPRRVAFDELRDIRKEKDWLTINGHFFTSNPALNLKLYKLLKKLRGWQEPIATVQV
ncbi:MAG: zinc ribbon domain-containing protein [Saprospiraceae bacterium]